MVSAILLAGYNNKREVKKYSRTVAEYYGEKFIEAGYKPLREFKTVKNGREESKPMIQYTLERLFENEFIDEIVIVGHRMLLEQRLGSFIKQFEKPCCIVNQNLKIPDDVIRLFNITPKKVKYNSISGNFIKGYAASNACKEKKHALFMASDSPLTTNEFINRFIKVVKQYKDKFAIIVPAILIDKKKDRLGRSPLRLRNDSKFQFTGKKNKYGSKGFRLSPLMSANPHRFDGITTKQTYRLLKWMRLNDHLKFFLFTLCLVCHTVFSK